MGEAISCDLNFTIWQKNHTGTKFCETVPDGDPHLFNEQMSERN